MYQNRLNLKSYWRKYKTWLAWPGRRGFISGIPGASAGFTVIIPGYDLVPLVRVGEIVDQIRAAFNWVVERMTPDQRIGLIEMLWEVAYADGVLDPEEDLLIRRIAGLIYVTDRDRVLARQSVLTRLGLAGA